MQSWGIIINGQRKNHYFVRVMRKFIRKKFRSYLTHIIKRIVSTCINYRIYKHVYDKNVYVTIIKKDIQNSKHHVRFHMPIPILLRGSQITPLKEMYQLYNVTVCNYSSYFKIFTLSK